MIGVQQVAEQLLPIYADWIVALEYNVCIKHYLYRLGGGSGI